MISLSSQPSEKAGCILVAIAALESDAESCNIGIYWHLGVINGQKTLCNV